MSFQNAAGVTVARVVKGSHWIGDEMEKWRQVVMWACEGEESTLVELCGFGRVGRYHFRVRSVDIWGVLDRMVLDEFSDVVNFCLGTLRTTKVGPLDSSGSGLSNYVLFFCLWDDI